MSIITLQQVMQATNYQVSGGSEYLWNSFGPNTHYMDFEINDEDTVDVVFDTKTQEVYQIDIVSDGYPFRWIHPGYVEAYKEECVDRNVEYEICCDDIKFNFEDDKDILRFIGIVVEGRSLADFYGTVSLDLDLSDKDMLELCIQAHERNITFNQHLNNIIADAVAYAEEVIAENEVKPLPEPEITSTDIAHFVAGGKILTFTRHSTQDLEYHFRKWYTVKDSDGKVLFTYDNGLFLHQNIDGVDSVIGVLIETKVNESMLDTNRLGKILYPTLASHKFKVSLETAMLEIVKLIVYNEVKPLPEPEVTSTILSSYVAGGKILTFRTNTTLDPLVKWMTIEDSDGKILFRVDHDNQISQLLENGVTKVIGTLHDNGTDRFYIETNKLGKILYPNLNGQMHNVPSKFHAITEIVKSILNKQV